MRLSIFSLLPLLFSSLPSLGLAGAAPGFARLEPGSLPLAGRTVEEKSRSFVDRFSGAWGIADPTDQLSGPEVRADRIGHRRVRYRQRHAGYPVVAAYLDLHFDAGERLVAVHASLATALPEETEARIEPAEASARAVAEVVRVRAPRTRPRARGPARLVVVRPGLARRTESSPRLAWEVEVADGGAIRDHVYVDATDGSVVERLPGVFHALDRTVHQTSYGSVIWTEGNSLPYSSGNTANDVQVNLLIDAGLDAYSLFLNLSGGTYESWDGAGAPMETVWKPSFTPCPNAFWNGLTVAFCDGVAPDDVAAHEWTHAFTEGTHGLIYQAQPGALNESYSDIFGELLDQINGEGTDAPGSPRQDGDCSTFGGAPPPLFAVTSPAGIAGTYPSAGATFNPAGPFDVSAAVELVDDGVDNGGATSVSDGCEPFVGFTPGRIALVDRGSCIFPMKTANAQAAGASAVLVVNFDDNVFGMSGSFPGATIPSLMIGSSVGAAIRSLPEGAVTAHIEVQPAETSSLRWLIAEDATTVPVLRDMWNPTCLGHPAKVSDSRYWCSPFDNDGVHINSGIPNHAFALLVDGGTYNGVTVNRIRALRAAHVYWRAMSVYQTPDSDFADHADSLLQSCEDLIGVDLPTLETGAPSGQSISAADCAEVAAAIAAVELYAQPACSFAPLLSPDSPPLACGTALFEEGFDSDPDGRWTFDNEGAFVGYEPRDWDWRLDPPAGGEGPALFADDDRLIGTCVNGDDQSRRLGATSPEIALDGDAVLSFAHYVATEFPADGGNLKVSVNGGAFVPLDASDFLFNPYNTTLAAAGPFNGNPLAGEPAFSGSDNAVLTGSWGVSHVSLSAHAQAGDTVRVRFDFGADGCSGLDGWYVDDIRLCSDVVTAGEVAMLLLDRTPAGDASLTWTPSCHGPDDAYAVYSGTLGDFQSHTPVTCATQAQAITVDEAGDRYFLVVPRHGAVEGSYGTANGVERSASAAACAPQAVSTACD